MKIDWHLVSQVSPPRRVLNKVIVLLGERLLEEFLNLMCAVWKVVAMKSLLWGENPQANKCQILCLQTAKELPWQWTASQRLCQHPSSCLHKNLATYHSTSSFPRVHKSIHSNPITH